MDALDEAWRRANNDASSMYITRPRVRRRVIDARKSCTAHNDVQLFVAHANLLHRASLHTKLK